HRRGERVVDGRARADFVLCEADRIPYRLLFTVWLSRAAPVAHHVLLLGAGRPVRRRGEPECRGACVHGLKSIMGRDFAPRTPLRGGAGAGRVLRVDATETCRGIGPLQPAGSSRWSGERRAAGYAGRRTGAASGKIGRLRRSLPAGSGIDRGAA